MRPAQGRMFVGLRNPGCDRRLISEIEIGQSRRFPEGAGGGKNFFCVSRNGGIATSFASQEPGEKRYPGRFAPPWRGRIFPLTNPSPQRRFCGAGTSCVRGSVARVVGTRSTSQKVSFCERHPVLGKKATITPHNLWFFSQSQRGKARSKTRVFVKCTDIFEDMPLSLQPIKRD